MVLTLSDEMDKYITESASKMGSTKMEYLRHLIIKDKEGKEK
jgi:hypothetical protein